METLLNDIRFGARMLLRNPAFTLAAMLALGLGIGANTAIFSVVNGVLIRPLSFKEPDRLVLAYASNPQRAIARTELSMADFVDYRDQVQEFEQFAGLRYGRFTVTGLAEPEMVVAGMVSVNFFSLLGIEPVHGRNFLPEEADPAGDRVAILSHGLWQRWFGADPKAIGKQMTVNGVIYTLIGVMPPEFDFPKPSELAPVVELWTPLTPPPQEWQNRGTRVLVAVARLKSGIPVESAQQSMEAVAARLSDQYPETNRGWGAQVIPLREQLLRGVRPALTILFVAVGLVLLVACANVANLQLAKASVRRREIALRIALGADRKRVVRQLLTESALLGIVSGVLGLAIAAWGTSALLSLNPGNIPRLDQIRLDGWVLSFTAVLSLAAGLIFALAPALQTTKPDLNQLLKDAGRNTTGGVTWRWTLSALVVAEIALSFVLLFGAGLLLNSFVRLLSVPAGFNPDNVVSMEISLPWFKYRQPQQQLGFYQRMFEGIARNGQAQTAAIVSHLPLTGANSAAPLEIEGRPLASGDQPVANWRIISPDYFKAMGIRLIQGRTFSEHDNSEAPKVVIINETMARRFWPGLDPIEKHMRLQGDQTPISVVGIVNDVRHWGLDSDTRPEMYFPFLQEPTPMFYLVMRTDSAPTAAAGSVRREISAIDPDQPVTSVKTMESLLANSVGRRRFSTLLLTIFAGLALALAAVGTSAMMAYSVAQRRHEIGIRMALGARRGDIMRLVLRQGLVLCLIGLVLGFVPAIALRGLIETSLFGVTSTDPATVAGIPIILIIAALVASYLPARRAAGVEPMTTLRVG